MSLTPFSPVERTYALGEFNKMTCTLTRDDPLPDWAQQLPAINVKRLRPEHGFLVIDRDLPIQWPRSIRWYSTHADRNHGVDITTILGSQPMNHAVGISPQFSRFKNAYYIGPVAPGLKHWWLHIDGRIEVAWAPTKMDYQLADGLGPNTIIPTAIGLVASANSARQTHIWDDGLYQLAGDGSPRRLSKGRIGSELETSPNGCQVAYLNDDRPWINAEHQFIYNLQVTNLCPEILK